MENWQETLKKLIELIGFDDYTLDVDPEHRHARIFIHNDPNLVRENLPVIVESLNHLVQLIARQHDQSPLYIDVNNYRKERENLIVELARATARKVVATKNEIPLPVMNSYERRLAHLELATHPDVFTESVGKGKGRYVIVKPVGERPPSPSADQSRGSE